MGALPRSGVVVTELDDESWPMFVAQRGAVVVLTRNDCENCEGFLTDLGGKEFSVGVIRLDAPGGG